MKRSATLNQPLVTFALFAYNQEKYIREAIEGAFAQTYEPLEIILSDDCSTDNTYQIIQNMAAMYDGPHKVRVRRNDFNLGLAAHINSFMVEAAGSIVSWSAGDDIAHPNRTSIFVAKLQECKDNIGVHSNVEEIDQEGRHIRFRQHSAKKMRISLELVTGQGISVVSQSHAFRKIAFVHFGPLCEDVTNEGIVMAFRETALGKVVFVKQPLTKYRVGSGTSTYRGEDALRRKILEPIKITGWHLSAFRQIARDLEKLPPLLIRKHKKEIDQKIAFFSALMEINTGKAIFRPLLRNFLAAPRDQRSLRSVIRMSLPTSLYRFFLR